MTRRQHRDGARENRILAALRAVNGGAVSLRLLLAVAFGSARTPASSIKRELSNLRNDGHQIELWNARTPFVAYQLITR